MRTPRSTTQPHSAHLIFTAASLLHPEDPQNRPVAPTDLEYVFRLTARLAYAPGPREAARALLLTLAAR